MPVCKYPMTGSALTTISPSISRITRNTPCVEGCCGPILRTMVCAGPIGVSTVVVIGVLRWGNPGAGGDPPNRLASGYDADPDALQNEGRRGPRLRVRANGPWATPERRIACLGH